MFAAKTLLLGRPAAATTGPVLFDSVGAGGTTGGTTAALTFTHTPVDSTPDAALCFVTHYITGSANSNLTVTYGGAGTPMTRLGSPVLFYDQVDRCYLSVYGLLSPPSGPRTVSITPPSNAYLKANAIAYNNVSAFGTPVVANGNSTSLAVNNVASASGRRVAQAFAQPWDIDGISSYNKTTRWSVTGGAWNAGMLIGDADGADLVSFSATASGAASFWGGIAVDLIP